MVLGGVMSIALLGTSAYIPESIADQVAVENEKAPTKTTFSISTNKTVIYNDGTGFNLFVMINTPRPVTDTDLDYSPLNKDFSVGNVKFNDKDKFTHTWVISLIPNRNGVIKVPSMNVGTSGELKTPRFELKIEAPSGLKAKNFIKSELRNTAPMKGQLAMYRVEIDKLPSVKIHTYTPPKADGVTFELFAERTVSRASAGNRFYKTTIREYKAIFKKEGKITIEGPSISGVLALGNSEKQFMQKAHNTNVVVAPNPSNTIVSDNLSITVQWSPEEKHIAVGEPITRTITYTATNNSLSQLPVIPIPEMENFDVYEDNTTEIEQLMRNKQLKSTRVIKQVFVPQKNHTVFNVENSRIDWINPKNGKPETCDIIGASYTIDGFSFNDYIPQDPKTAYWIGFGIVMGILFIIFMIYSISWYRRRVGVYGWLHQKVDYAGYWHQLSKNWKNNDPIRCRTALLDWAQKRWPDKTIVGLTSIPFYKEIKTEANNLSQACWSKDHAQWNGKALYKLVSKYKNYQKAKAKRGINPYGLNGEIYETVQQTLKS